MAVVIAPMVLLGQEMPGWAKTLMAIAIIMLFVQTVLLLVEVGLGIMIARAVGAIRLGRDSIVELRNAVKNLTGETEEIIGNFAGGLGKVAEATNALERIADNLEKTDVGSIKEAMQKVVTEIDNAKKMAPSILAMIGGKK